MRAAGTSSNMRNWVTKHVVIWMNCTWNSIWQSGAYVRNQMWYEPSSPLLAWSSKCLATYGTISNGRGAAGGPHTGGRQLAPGDRHRPEIYRPGAGAVGLDSGREPGAIARRAEVRAGQRPLLDLCHALDPASHPAGIR